MSKGTQRSIDQGTRETAGGKDTGEQQPKRTDGWKTLKERVCREETDGRGTR